MNKFFKINKNEIELDINLKNNFLEKIFNFFNNQLVGIMIVILTLISIASFVIFYQNGLGLAYNDARSHLDIGRRVVESLKPGFAQLGSVWLPLPHFLMLATIWNDFMWHSGLSGALQSMISFVATGYLIYLFLKKLGVGVLGRVTGVAVFAANINILYLQSTAMTELLLIATMMAGVYELVNWFGDDRVFTLLKAAFWIMLSTLIRYDGWFLFLFSTLLIGIQVLRKKGYKATEGTILFFATFAGFGIFLWILWNLLIFKDPFYFISGPYSAAAQQQQLAQAGVLATKGNLLFSIKMYLYGLAYNSNTFISVLGAIGVVVFWLDRKMSTSVKIASLSLLAPLLFNILALYMGQSVLFIQGLSGNSWFNVRYGIMLMPTIAIFIGYLVNKFKELRPVIIGLLVFVLFFSFANADAVTIDDARVGSSQKNVSEVAGWLRANANDKPGFVLISVASHDAIIFSSGLLMSRFIHEGTGLYWDSATQHPAKWARWIIMRTYDDNDGTYHLIKKNPELRFYTLVHKYPFADIYEIKPQYVNQLITKPILGTQK